MESSKRKIGRPTEEERIARRLAKRSVQERKAGLLKAKKLALQLGLNYEKQIEQFVLLYQYDPVGSLRYAKHCKKPPTNRPIHCVRPAWLNGVDTQGKPRYRCPDCNQTFSLPDYNSSQ